MALVPLFDIDNTLLRSGNRVHEKAFDVAIKKVFGVEVRIADYDWTGKIDNQIIVEMLSMKGVEEGMRERVKEVTEEMSVYFSQHRQEFVSELMPGVISLLVELKQRRVLMGILTGNVEKIGWQKLEGAGIADYFEFGAFGDMAFVRSDLVALAAHRAGVASEQCVIVGDSPLDIRCAKEAGVRVIAVGAGKYSGEELAGYDPDLVVESLRDKDKVMEFLLQ